MFVDHCDVLVSIDDIQAEHVLQYGFAFLVAGTVEGQMLAVGAIAEKEFGHAEWMQPCSECCMQQLDRAAIAASGGNAVRRKACIKRDALSIDRGEAVQAVVATKGFA